MKKSMGSVTMAYPAPVFIVGSYDDDGLPDVMNAAWGGICNSEPPCIAISIRKNRESYDNIQKRGSFTVSIPSEKFMAEADYFGMVSGREHRKFEETGLTAIRGEHVDAPYVGEFPIVLECRVRVTTDLGSHVQFVGEILDVKIDEEVLNEGGIPDPERVKPLIYAPLHHGYYGLGNLLGRAFHAGQKVKK